jgi:CheY-like chemotaxis protein
MTAATPTVLILIADDDEDDVLLTRNALAKNKIRNEVHWVKDGVELLEYLRHQGRHAEPADAPRPHLILLDLNMPRKNGLEALREIKADVGLRLIPVVALTTSQAEEDVLRSYDLGVSSFIIKPVDFDGLVRVMRSLEDYWFQIVRLPGAAGG